MKMRILMLATLFLGALIQQLLPAWPLFGGMKPPILPALCLHYALRRNFKDMWIAVLVAAVLQDGLDLGTFGPALLAFPLIGLAANRIRAEIFSEALVTQICFGAAMGLFTTFIAVLVYAASGQRPFGAGLTLLRLAGSLLLGMATLPLVSRSIVWLENALPKRRGYGWQ